MIFGYTKFYRHREKANSGFAITDEKIRLYLGLLLLNGCHKFLDRKEVLIQCLVVSSSIFFGIFIFVTKNNLKHKKFLKLLPVVNKWNRRFLKFSFNR